jgi:cytidyltransferase-like protein
MKKYPIGMVYGVFDGFHEGHRHFLREAMKHCHRLIVVVAHPDMVKLLKDRTPYYALDERLAAIRAFHPTAEVIIGDCATGQWTALKHYQPDIVLLGYDQNRLGTELKKIGVRSRIITAHFPTKFKSSILNKHRTDI